MLEVFALTGFLRVKFTLTLITAIGHITLRNGLLIVFT